MNISVFVVVFILECSLILFALPCLWFSRLVANRASAWRAEQSGRHFWYTQMFYFCECRIKPIVLTSGSFAEAHSIIFIFFLSLFLLFFSLPLFFFCFLFAFRLYFSRFGKRNIIYCQLTLWSRVRLQKLTVAQRVSIYVYKRPVLNVNFI
jgi:hypothetical protein